MSVWGEGPSPTSELAALAKSAPFMYEWDLGGGIRTRAIGPELQDVHNTRAAIMGPVIRDAWSEDESAIDLACSEGWFSHRLLDWGARQVFALDVRRENIHRAKLINEQLQSPGIYFEVADVFDLPPLEPVDVVLCVGLIYHVENPIGLLRIARALTRGVCIVESQMTEPHPPIQHGWGTTGEYLEQPAAWATWYEPVEAQEEHPIASFGGVVSFIPNRVALEQAMRAAGFSRVEAPPVPADANAQYTGGHRLVLAGYP